MRAEAGKREREKEEKRKGNSRKNGDQSLLYIYISPRAGFFICAVVIFQIYKENCI